MATLYDMADEITRLMSPQGTEVIRNRSGGVERHLPGLIGKMFRIERPETIRIGHCFMAGRLLKGDLALGVCHSGDCFQHYILVQEFSNCLRGLPQFDFGSYGIGDNPLAEEYILTGDSIEVLKSGGTVGFCGETDGWEPKIEKCKRQD